MLKIANLCASLQYLNQFDCPKLTMCSYSKHEFHVLFITDSEGTRPTRHYLDYYIGITSIIIEFVEFLAIFINFHCSSIPSTMSTFIENVA